MAFKVFLSYSTKDLEIADSVHRILNGGNVDVFMAERSLPAGEVLPTRIKRQIESCDLFLLLWSRHSQTSEWVRHETGIADGCKRIILPLVLARRATLPPPLQQIKYISAHDDLGHAFRVLRENVYARAERKQQIDGLAWLTIGAAVAYWATRK